MGGLGGLEGSWEEEVGKIAMAGSHYHPEEAKSMRSIAFLKVSAELSRGSQLLLAEDQGGTFHAQMPREGGQGGKVNLPKHQYPGKLPDLLGV